MLRDAGIIMNKPPAKVITLNLDLYSQQLRDSLTRVDPPSGNQAPGNYFIYTENGGSNEMITQEWSLIDIVNRKPIIDWLPVFQDSYNDLIRINNFLQSSGPFYPLKKDIFRALQLVKPTDIKIIIIGQDPYPGTGGNGLPVAHGLAFSTDRSNKIPASLAGVYKVLAKTIPGWVYPSHGDLTCWVKQGILLLNKCLTLDPGASGSHKNLWGEFITRVVQYIDKVNPNCVYLLWGNHAQEIAKFTTSKNVLMTSHPSPQGIHHGFINCNHFNEANDILVKQGKSPVDWSVT
jgi:uracil-DNA glycosylase